MKYTIFRRPCQYQPKNFILYGGVSLDDINVIANVKNAQKTGADIIVDFDTCKIRYYKLYCTETFASTNQIGSRYIAFKGINFNLSSVLSNGVQLSPDDSVLTYKGNWKITNEVSTFGRIYNGKNDAVVTFDFKGSYFAITSYKSLKYNEFLIYIDDNFAQKISLNSNDEKTMVVYFSDKLKNCQHNIKIVGKGEFNIDSVVFWQ